MDTQNGPIFWGKPGQQFITAADLPLKTAVAVLLAFCLIPATSCRNSQHAYRKEIQERLESLNSALDQFHSGEDRQEDAIVTQNGKSGRTAAPMPASLPIVTASHALQKSLRSVPLTILESSDQEIDRLGGLLKKDLADARRRADKTISKIKSTCSSRPMGCRSPIYGPTARIDSEGRLSFIAGDDGVWADKLFDYDMDAWTKAVKAMAAERRNKVSK